MKYAYESHLGGVYFTNKHQVIRVCRQCGDSDRLIGVFDTLEEFVKAETDEEGFCPYVQKYLEEEWNYEG